MAELLPCPFCGGEAEIERYGDRRSSTVYRCTFCSCSLETGEEWDHGTDWNRRAVPAGYVPASEVQRAREEALRLREALADHATKFDVLGAYIEAGDGKSLSHEKIFEWAKQARALATPPAENGEG